MLFPYFPLGGLKDAPRPDFFVEVFHIIVRVKIFYTNLNCCGFFMLFAFAFPLYLFSNFNPILLSSLFTVHSVS